MRADPFAFCATGVKKMRIVCNTTQFTEVCLNVQRCVPNKAVLPHLEGILIQTLDTDSVMLSGFDLELGITVKVEARVERPGAAVLNAKRLCDILRALSRRDEIVVIDCDEKNVCTIQSGSTNYTLISLNPAEYPELPELTEEKPLTVRQTLLRDMIKQTIFAVSLDDYKAVHRGVKFEVTPGQIKLVALDGYRLAIRTEFIEYNGKAFSFVVPAKALAEIIKFIGDEDAFIDMSVGRRHILFNIGAYTIISRLLEGEFLNYAGAIPTAKDATVRVDTQELIDIIDRASVMIPDKSKSPIRMIFDEDIIRVSTVSAEGSFHDKIAGSTEGKRTEIGFNNRFVLDALRSCDTDEVLINLNGPVAPAVIVPPEGDNFLYLILPVRPPKERE